MPNHIMNKVSVSDKFEEIAKAVKSKESAFDFEKIVPMPKSLMITSGSSTDEGIALLDKNSAEAKTYLSYGWTDKNKKKIKTYEQLVAHLKDRSTPEEIAKRLEEGRTALDNIKKYGCKDWYEWSIQNWGTKWNAYEVIADYGEQFEFQTAWSTPMPVIIALSKMFKGVQFQVEYADEDMGGGNCGTYTILDGEVIADEQGDIDFAYQVWGMDRDEDEDLED